MKDSRTQQSRQQPTPVRTTIVSANDASRDQIFESSNRPLVDFVFDNKVAAVFDDMVDRSVPLYTEIQRMTCELAADFASPGSRIYDMGCGTGTTMAYLDKYVPPDVELVGIDNSVSMLNQATDKLEPLKSRRKIDLITADINSNPGVRGASVVLLILTLQFVRPLYRGPFLEHLYQGLAKNGCIILVEKILVNHGLLNRQFIKHYYEMKRRNGYSDVEISRKRESLENVLVPYRYRENIQLLQSAGFEQIEEFFRWYNFSGIIAVK